MPPTISLAMIVRDEEDNLRQCLDSVRAHVDSVIIVDTGSTDNTVAVAQSYGAQIHYFTPTTHPEAFYLDDAATCSTFTAPPPYSGDVAFADFGAARAESFKHATGDYIIWLDADDVLTDADQLRPVVADMAVRNLDMGFIAYNYATDHLGRVFYRQWRERIIKRGAANWTNPVHEVLLPTRQVTTAKYERPLVTHKRKADRRSIPNRNYKILLRQHHQLKSKGAEIDPRSLFYLGQEARFIEPARAVEFYEDYLTKSGWPEERAAAHAAIGSILEFGGLPIQAGPAFARADMHYAASAIEMPDNPDGLLGLARIAYLRGRWMDCVNYTQRAFAIGNTDSMLGANPMDRLYRPHVYLNHALAKLGRLPEAIESCRAALSVCPDDPGVPGGASGMIAFNLDVYQKQLSPAQPKQEGQVNFSKEEDVDAPPVANIPKDALVIWALQLWKQCVAMGNGEGARRLIEALPPHVAADPVVAKMRASTERRFGSTTAESLDSGGVRLKVKLPAPEFKENGGRFVAPASYYDPPPGTANSLSVIIWIGPAIEPWNPETPNKQGIGGSETACIEIARELTKRGHRVLVYGECQGMEGTFDGVEYRHYQRAERFDCDVFIASRAPAIMEAHDKINARVKLLWVHDIHVGANTPQMERWLYRFDRVLCLSKWHRDFFLKTYPWLDGGRVLVTRNGINEDRFPACPDCGSFDSCENECLGRGRIWDKPNRLIFSSSPNRGLDVLLMLFPAIRAQVPDAELHIYYGFDCWEAFARRGNNTQELAVIDEYKRRINDAVRAGGVTFHGRVNQRELADAFMRSKVWSYPTNFNETSCCGAMEAQAAGCVPVCPPLAALAETVKHGVFVEGGDAFVAACVRLLKDEEYRLSFAEPGRKYALANLTWRGLAEEWERMFRSIERENKTNPIALYREVAA